MSVDVEDHIWHFSDVVTVDHILRKTEKEKKVIGKVKLYFTLSHSVNQHVFLFGTYISVLAASFHLTVDVVYAPLRSNDQGGASVHDSLTTATASHNVTIDSNTERDSKYTMYQTDIKHIKHIFGLDTFLKICDAASVALPVQFDLPVQLIRKWNPSDGTRVVCGVNTTKGHHTAMLRVTTEENENLLINLLKISCSLSISKNLCCNGLAVQKYFPFSR